MALSEFAPYARAVIHHFRAGHTDAIGDTSIFHLYAFNDEIGCKILGQDSKRASPGSIDRYLLAATVATMRAARRGWTQLR